MEGYSTEASPRTAGSVRWTTAGAPVIERERRYRHYSSNDLSFQSELHGKLTTGWLQHEVLAGIDSYHFKLDQLMKRGRSTTNYGLNIDNPSYGQTPLTLNTTPTDVLEDQRNTGLFLQDQMTFGKDWRLLLGLRHDHFSQEINHRLSATRTEQEHGVTTPRLGVTYLMTPTLAVYTLISQSFRANNGVDAYSNSFSPERGKSREIGLKYETLNKRYGGTLSIFEIDKNNVLTNDPANAGFSIAAGQARSRGIEFDFSGQVTNKLRLLGNYAYIDAKITQDNNTSLVGARLTNIPKHTGSVLAMYEDQFAEGRYGFGAGATYVGQRAGNSIDSFTLPSYTLMRAMAYWKPNKTLRFSLDIDNLFDKTYYASSYDVYWVTPGTPRTITLGMQAKF